MSERHEVRGPSGLLEVFAGGPADGAVLICQHGTPSAGLLFEHTVAQAAQRGLRTVSYARPGYGESTRHAGRVVADCVADIAAIADALGVDRFYTTGQSGGGPHALATAALLGDRVIAAATIGGVAPWAAAGLDFLAGMGPENHVEFNAAAAGENELRPLLAAEASALSQATADQIGAAMGELMSDVDLASLARGYADYMAEQFHAAVRHGVDGWLDDDLAFVSPWGFELAQITVPVSIWQGDEDRFVPRSHGQWLAAHVPGATPKLLPGQGHLSIEVDLWGDVVDWLKAAGR